MFVTHASVRVKGSENCYEPVLCNDTECSRNPTPHMHCPFCPPTECYLDAAILRAHYRVKHVDKGIDVYGLRIVRCCDRCDIVGSIKGTKEIRGAHWHCYRCRNGFNRRDEAIKHYRTHFRSPQTTYQIQIVSDVNQALVGRKNTALKTDVVSSSCTTDGANEVSGRLDGGSLHESTVAANETVIGTSSAGDMHLLVVDAEAVDVLSSGDGDVTNVDIGDEVVAADIVSSPSSWTVASADVESRLAELQCRYDRLAADKKATESRLRAEIKMLQHRVDLQAAEIAKLCNAGGGEGAARPTVATRDGDLPNASVDSLLERLRSEYDHLMRKQVAEVRHECIRLFALESVAPNVVDETAAASNSTSEGSESMEQQCHVGGRELASEEVERDDYSNTMFVDGGMTEHVVKFHSGDEHGVVVGGDGGGDSTEYEIVAVPLEDSAGIEEFPPLVKVSADGCGRQMMMCVRGAPEKRRNDGDLVPSELNGTDHGDILTKRSKLYCSQ